MRHSARQTTASCWPEGSRLILRKERPHPGAQLTLTDIDGRRSTVFLTGTGRDVIPGQAAGLQPRHRGCRRKGQRPPDCRGPAPRADPGTTRWNGQDLPQRLRTMKDHGDTGRGDRTAHLMLTEQSGAKRKVPQPSLGAAMIEAEQAMRRAGCRLRAVKVVRRHTAVARWKVGKQGWHRVA
jgi:hypothetical protein